MYSPKIAEFLIPSLYRLACLRSTPMTTLVSEVIADYLAQQPDLQEILPQDAPTLRLPDGTARDADMRDAGPGASRCP